MKNRLRFSLLQNRNSFLSVFLLAVLFVSASAQAQAPRSESYTRRTSAIDQANSRAEREAEQLVSLSADKIIALLQNEPGLLLEVKKMLVRKAYEQGRLLDAHDLTDDALYRLISKDEMIRVLVTREIEDRGYVHVKPTQEELAREQALRSTQASATEAVQQEADVKSGKSQEEAYWSRRQKELLNENVKPALPSNRTLPLSLLSKRLLPSINAELLNVRKRSIMRAIMLRDCHSMYLGCSAWAPISYLPC
jgi:hypothetical protein